MALNLLLKSMKKVTHLLIMRQRQQRRKNLAASFVMMKITSSIMPYESKATSYYR